MSSAEFKGPGYTPEIDPGSPQDRETLVYIVYGKSYTGGEFLSSLCWFTTAFPTFTLALWPMSRFTTQPCQLPILAKLGSYSWHKQPILYTYIYIHIHTWFPASGSRSNGLRQGIHRPFGCPFRSIRMWRNQFFLVMWMNLSLWDSTISQRSD